MTLPDAVHERAVRCECFQGHVSCARCNASGVTGPELMTCGECGGMGGWVCAICNGTGYKPCERCGGSLEVDPPEWDRQYDAAMQWRDWQTCDQLLRERTQKPCPDCQIGGKPSGFALRDEGER